jgi:hypothetical protein
MLYQVTLMRTVVGKDGWAHCERTVQLPFVPWLGLAIDGGKVKTLDWVTTEERFTAWVEAWRNEDRSVRKGLKEALGPDYEDEWVVTLHIKGEGQPAAEKPPGRS